MINRASSTWPLGRVAGSIDAGPVPGRYDAPTPSACHTPDQYTSCNARGLAVSLDRLRKMSWSRVRSVYYYRACAVKLTSQSVDLGRRDCCQILGASYQMRHNRHTASGVSHGERTKFDLSATYRVTDSALIEA